MRFIHLKLEEIINGTIKTIEFQASEDCKKCSGSGLSPDSKNIPCPRCRNTGSIVVSTKGKLHSIKCPSCQGKAFIGGERCTECNGTGHIEKNIKTHTRIPKGLIEGDLLKVYDPDLNVNETLKVKIAENDFYKINQCNIYVKLPVLISTAILGGRISIPTVSGMKSIDIQPGTQNNTVIELKNDGLYSVKSKDFGSLYLEIQLITPTNLTHSQKSILKGINF